MIKALNCAFIFFLSFLYSQEMTTYTEVDGYYKIDYPMWWKSINSSDNSNQVYFYPEDESLTVSIIFGDLEIDSNAKAILDETLKYLNTTNLIEEKESYATEEELKKWNADTANVATFNVEDNDITYTCIMVIMTKDTFYYSIIFLFNSYYNNDENIFQVLNNMINSFEILK